MTICEKCKEKACVKTGKPCKEVEAMLPKPRSGTNGRREIITDPQFMEQVVYKTRQKRAHTYDNNWEEK
jgi:hypothetical protein